MFKIDNFIVDRVLRAYILDEPNGKLIGYLDQLTDASIEMGSETQDVTDARGVLIKRFYRAKTATFNATNAILNLNIMNLALGSDKSYAEDEAFTMPTSVLIPGGTATYTLNGYVEGSCHVYEMSASGDAGTEFSAGTAASATEFKIETDGTLTLPTATVDNFFVYYTKTVSENGVKWVNSADEFPENVAIVIECLGYQICNLSDPQILVISGDSFQISPDVTINVGGGDSQTIDLSGEFSVAYCNNDKSLFSIFIAEDSE